MRENLLDAWRTIVPARDDPSGPLPALLVVLTFVTGLVDAFSYLELRHVFVANMTGNVVFLAFSLGGSREFVWWASLLAISAFVVGALAGGRIAHLHGGHRGHQLFVAVSGQTVLVVLAFVLDVTLARPYSDGAATAMISLLAVGMGLQNATVLTLAVPGLTTTVMTRTITGILADTAANGSGNRQIGRRVVSVGCLFVGALTGAMVIEHGHGRWELLIAVALLIAVVAATARVHAATGGWANKRS
ncbi:YoaK family protein [Pseudofrankia sp. DC12]|uniref:YoaK family protein n=1 Tax=Pseudofrankia sp. DC12 TaxID=683315 RepID=UPI0005F7EB20|nr:YoaK family protein [Pseudofrankia sp. DC12]